MKSVFAILLIFILFWFEVITVDALNIICKRPEKTIVAFLILVFSFFVGVLRWKILLEAVNISVNFGKLTQIYGASIFLGNVLPSSIGGDALRIFYIIRETGGKENIKVTSTIIADRIMGLIGFLILGLLLIFIQKKFYGANDLRGTINDWYKMITLFLVLSFIVCFIIFFYAKKMNEKIKGSFQEKHGIKKWIYRINVCLVEVLLLYRHKKIQLFLSFMLSLIISSLVICIIPILAKPFEYSEMNHLNYLIAAVIANLSNVVPLTPGGIGIGESVFNYVCHHLETVKTLHAYGNIFFQSRIALLCLNLLGGLGFIFYSRTSSREHLHANVT